MTAPFHGFFELRTARDLLEKLRRDLERLRAAPLDTDAAFNFFVTAEHLLDWVYPKKAGTAQRTAERKASSLLQVCSHLANGAKHFETEAKQHKSVDQTVKRSGFFPAGMFPPGFLPMFPDAQLVVKLKGGAAKALGSSVPALTLAEQVLKYWDAHANIT